MKAPEALMKYLNEMAVKLVIMLMKYPNEIRNERVWNISLPLPILYERLHE